MSKKHLQATLELNALARQIEGGQPLHLEVVSDGLAHNTQLLLNGEPVHGVVGMSWELGHVEPPLLTDPDKSLEEQVETWVPISRVTLHFDAVSLKLTGTFTPDE